MELKGMSSTGDGGRLLVDEGPFGHIDCTNCMVESD
jgi:hypothetical protein